MSVQTSQHPGIDKVFSKANRALKQRLYSKHNEARNVLYIGGEVNLLHHQAGQEHIVNDNFSCM